jgi:hypothetical protein
MPNIKDRANIWVPPSFTHKQAAAVDSAVREYDPNLGFGLNEQSGQWCIFLRHGSNELTAESDLPVLGFEDIPHPDDALRRLHQADALRTGHEILDQINRANKEIQDDKDLVAQQAIEETAEGFDWGFRQMGKAPYSKVFINRED